MKTLDGVNKKNDVKKSASEAPEKNVEAAPEKIDFSNVKIEPIFEEMVDFDTFAKSDYTDDIDSVYRTLIENQVECLSEPQYFDFRADGFGESRAFYFRDPDGIILEMMQPL